MFALQAAASAEEHYAALLASERDQGANAANLAALVFHGLPQLNWAGFYWLKGEELVLGPFQGQPACVRIALGRGVCGTAAAERRTIVVPDVNRFPGHIACDSASRSEVVVPVLQGAAWRACSTSTAPSPGASARPMRAGWKPWWRSSSKPPRSRADACPTSTIP